MEIDSIHFYVSNANKTSRWFVNHLGFAVVDRYQDTQNFTVAVACTSVLLVISSPLQNKGLVADYLKKHAEGVVDISFRVQDLQALVLKQKSCFRDICFQNIRQDKQVLFCLISGWGSLRHTLLTTKLVRGCYSLPSGDLRIIPAAKQVKDLRSIRSPLQFTQIDHVVLNVAKENLTKAVKYYQTLFDWQVQQTFQIATQNSGLSSQALIDSSGRVQFNINEPTTANSQIQEFIDLNNGSGIQHLALRSLDLIADVAKMRDRGVDFLPIPDTYYRRLNQEFADLENCISVPDLPSMAKQAILLDWERSNPSKQHRDAFLMQIFTKPILSQPTFFLEFIERHRQAKGFGEGNFQALFTAVEAEQINSFS